MAVLRIVDLMQSDEVLWWQAAALWHDDPVPDVVDRPTELEAVRNVFYEARAVSGSLRSVLSELEKIVYDYDLECKRKAPHMHTLKDRIGWILENMQRRRIGVHLTFWQVHGILDEIDMVQRNMSMLEHMEKRQHVHMALNELKLEAAQERSKAA